MKLTNNQIANANYALGELVNEKLVGSFKFKLFKAKSELEQAMEVIQKSLDGVDVQDEQNEILNEEQEVNFELFTEDELSQLPLSMKQISMLQPIIKGEDE